MSVLIEQDREAELFQRGARRFLWAGFAATLLVVVAIMSRQGWFKDMAELSFVTDSAQDLNKGQQVKIAGFRVGSVRTVALQPDGSVQVNLSIDEDYLRFVTTDAVVELRKEGLVGSAVLEIVAGSDKSKLATDQARLTFARADSLSAIALDLRSRITPVLDDVKAITGTIADPQQGLPATLQQIKVTTRSLNALLDTGTRQTDQVGDSLKQTLDSTRNDMAALGRTLETVNQRLPGMLERTQQVIDQTSGVLRDVQTISSQAQTTVPPTLQSGQAIAADVQQVLSGAKTTWPLNKLVDAPAAQRLKLDSEPPLAPAAPTVTPASPGVPHAR